MCILLCLLTDTYSWIQYNMVWRYVSRLTYLAGVWDEVAAHDVVVGFLDGGPELPATLFLVCRTP